MTRLWFAFLVSIGFTCPATASSPASPDPQSLTIPAEELSKARELVQQLGSEQFAERERAELALAKMGRLARPVLIEAAKTDADPEVRYRCSRLLPRAISLDLKARLEVFLADSEGKFEHDLQGWNQFRDAIRNDWYLFGHLIHSDRTLDKAARTAFADLIATPANRQLLMAVGGTQSDLGQIVALRRQELYSMRLTRVVNGQIVRPTGTPSAEDVAVLLFAESQVPSKLVPRTVSGSIVSSLISTSGFMNIVKDTEERGKVYRAIASAWFDSREDPLDMYYAMSVANTLSMPEQAGRLAVRLITTPGVSITYRGQAVNILGQSRNKDYLPMLEKLMADKTVVYTMPARVVAGNPNPAAAHDVQARDLALAASVLLSGQKLEDFGFTDRLTTAKGVAGTTYSYSRHYLPAEDREDMFAKWKKWRAENP